MILRRTYAIGSYTSWDATIDAAAQDFMGRFGCAPNIMLANPATYGRIEMAARRENIRDDQGQVPPEGQYTPLTHFSGDFYELELCIDPRLDEGQVSLIFDDEPEGGGEPVPVEDTDVLGDDREMKSCA